LEKKESLIETKSFEFSLNIIALYKKLVEENEYVISKQILRSGTSIGANIQEASAAFSKKDFLYKMSISSKEARETRYWLQLLDKSKLTNINVNNQIIQVQDIINILTKIIKTTQEKIQ